MLAELAQQHRIAFDLDSIFCMTTMHAGEGDIDNGRADEDAGKGDAGKGDTGKGADGKGGVAQLEAELEALLAEGIAETIGPEHQVVDPQLAWEAVRNHLEYAREASMAVGKFLGIAIAKGDLGVALARVQDRLKGGKGGADAGKGAKGTMMVAKGDKGGKGGAGKGDNEKDGEVSNARGINGNVGNDKGGKGNFDGNFGGTGCKNSSTRSETDIGNNIRCPHCLSTVPIFTKCATKIKVRHRVVAAPYPESSDTGGRG